MTLISLPDLIARLDLYLPWLLPALETIELTVPAAVRLLICAVLLAGLVVLRQRSAASATSRLRQVLVGEPASQHGAERT